MLGNRQCFLSAAVICGSGGSKNNALFKKVVIFCDAAHGIIGSFVACFIEDVVNGKMGRGTDRRAEHDIVCSGVAGKKTVQDLGGLDFLQIVRCTGGCRGIVGSRHIQQCKKSGGGFGIRNVNGTARCQRVVVGDGGIDDGSLHSVRQINGAASAGCCRIFRCRGPVCAVVVEQRIFHREIGCFQITYGIFGISVCFAHTGKVDRTAVGRRRIVFKGGVFHGERTVCVGSGEH